MTGTTPVTTLLHLERFHFGAASGGTARFAAWPLTSLTAQAVGSWLVPIGLGNQAVLREGDLRRARVPALTSVAYGLLQLGAIARSVDQVQWDEAGAWIWLALLINAIVTGGYQLLATAGGTAQGRPAIIRRAIHFPDRFPPPGVHSRCPGGHGNHPVRVMPRLVARLYLGSSVRCP